MEQLVTANLGGREDHTTVQETVDGCQQVLPVVGLVRRLVEVLKDRTETEVIIKFLPHHVD